MSKITYPFGIKKAATLCVLQHDESFLLLKRAKEPNKGMYTPVGGKLDPFENPLDAAIRETYEETEIQLDSMKYGGVLTESSPTSYNWIGFVYLAKIDRIPPPPCNEGLLEWIPFNEVLNLPTPKTDWYIYDYLLKKQAFAFTAEYDDQLNLLWMREEIRDQLLYQR